MSGGFAELKTHVLTREEKGLFGIPFKRFMVAGVVAAFAFVPARFTLDQWAVPCTIGIFIAAVIFSGTRGGLPLYTRLYLSLRGYIILLAARQATGLAGKVVQAANLPVHLATLDAEVIFAPPIDNRHVDLSDLVMYATPEEAAEDEGLIFVKDPLADLLSTREMNAVLVTPKEEA